MKEFLVGLLFLIVAAAFSVIGFFLFPILTGIVGIILIPVLAILAIWLLGKLILYLKDLSKKK